jgi:hypothetical protein
LSRRCGSRTTSDIYTRSASGVVVAIAVDDGEAVKIATMVKEGQRAMIMNDVVEMDWKFAGLQHGFPTSIHFRRKAKILSASTLELLYRIESKIR